MLCLGIKYSNLICNGMYGRQNLSRREYSEACFTILHMIDVNYYIFAESKRDTERPKSSFMRIVRKSVSDASLMLKYL